MKAVEIRKDIYWVGAIDWSMRSFHGYETSRGSSYNAYLILDEKITLIDTVKEPFKEELLERVASVIDPSKIDYIISNHVEPDHSGALPFMMAHCPNAKVITSIPQGLKGLKARYGDLPYEGVKAGDTLSIGKRTLQFVPTPMLHWPDSMVTYCPEEKILFSNDAFGQHLASGSRFDDENDLSVLYYEAKKYYANILTLYGRQAQAALKALKGLDIEMIATGHGISTEQMARTITEAFQEKDVPATFYDVKENALSDIMTDILTSEYLAVGSPTINNQMLPTVASFLCYLKGLTAKGHKAFAFGSYGWGGQSIALVEDELKAADCDIVLDKQRLLNTPDKDTLEALREAVHTIVE